MTEKLKESSKSTNFWNNLSNIASLGTMVILVSFIKDQEVIKNMVIGYMASAGFFNTGNILSHLNKNK